MMSNSGCIDFKQGDDFVISAIEVLTPSGQAMATIDYVVDFKMRHVETGALAVGLVTSEVDSTHGIYKVFASRADTTTWKLGEYHWDVSVTDSNNVKLSSATGQVRVMRGVN